MREALHIGGPWLLLFVAACSGSPSGPSPVADRAVPRTLALGCGMELDGYQCSADLPAAGGARRDITAFATWSTSDTRIATVNSVGFVTVAKAGEVAIRAEYQGALGSIVMQVEPGGLRQYYRALSGWITDAQTSAKLSGVKVEIRDGANAGRTAVTGNDGAYQLYDLQTGSFSVRFTKAGYATAERTFNLSGDGFNSLDVSLTR